jgi:hypothetical protein
MVSYFDKMTMENNTDVCRLAPDQSLKGVFGFSLLFLFANKVSSTVCNVSSLAA